MVLHYSDVRSPIGTIRLVASDRGLCSVDSKNRWSETRTRLEQRFGTVELVQDRSLSGLVQRLERYFSGDLQAFDGVRLDPGGSPFQRRVWAALRTIPAGTTTSYGELARKLGIPGAARAVGGANGRNPISIVVPCHRVINANGSLGGYAGGIDRKRWLLRHEGVEVPDA